MAYTTPDVLLSLQTLTKSNYDKIRDSIIACAHAVFELGGSRTMPILAGGGAKDVQDYREFSIPTIAQGGFTFKVEVEIRTENAATTATPRLYNVTDSVVAWTGSVGASITWGTPAYQLSSALTIAAGKRYRLQATKSDDVYDAWIIGRIVRTA